MARRQMGYTVAEGKEAFAALVEEAAAKHGLLHKDGSADLYAFAELAGFKSRTTLHNAITIKERGVGFPTLLKLVKVSDRPLSEWAASVGKSAPDLSGGAAPVNGAHLHPLVRRAAHLIEEYATTDAEKALAVEVLVLHFRGRPKGDED